MMKPLLQSIVAVFMLVLLNTAHLVVSGEQAPDNTITSLGAIRAYGRNDKLNTIESTNR